MQTWLIVLICIISFLIFADILTALIVIIHIGRPKKRTDDFLIDYETREKGFQQKWLSIPYKKKYMQSQYGYKLFGRLYRNPTPTNKFLIDVHGHNSSSLSQLKYLEIFLNLGYNVFIPDHRRSGQSEGKTITFGCYEKHDIVAWINLLQQENSAATFGIFGESMGAATAIMVTAMDNRIQFLIEYCGFANFADLIIPFAHSKFVYYSIALALRMFFFLILGGHIRETNALKAMAKVTVPTLILHSKGDKLVYVNNAYALHSANKNAEMVIFEQSRHARALVTDTEKDLFINTVNNFVKNTEKKLS